MDHIVQIDFTDLLQDLIPMLRSIFIEISRAEPGQIDQLRDRIQTLAEKDFKSTLKAHYYLSLCPEYEGNVSQQALLGLYDLLGKSSQVLSQQDILQLVDDLFSRIPTSTIQSTIRNIWMNLKRNLPHVVTEALILEKIETLISGIQDNNEVDKVASHWLVMIELICVQPEALDMIWAQSIPKLAAIIENGMELAENIDSDINPLTLMTIITKTFDYLCTMDLNVGEIQEGLKVISALICKSTRILSVRRGNEDLLNSVFESFENIFASQNFQTELKEEFFWQILTDIIEQEESRPSCIDKALELLCSYASLFQVEVRRSKRFVNTFFTTCFSLLCNVPLAEEEQWLHLSSEEINQYNDETLKYGIASSKLDEFSTSIGQSLILESCTEAIKSSIKDPDWKIRHAGYSLLSIISEACKQAFKENKQEVLQLAASGVIDKHPQVQEAGIKWLALFISALSPEVPREHHDEIVSKLMSLIVPDDDTSTEFKIKGIALAALVNTFKGLADSHDEEVEEKDKKTKFIIHSHMDRVFPVLISMLRDTLNSTEEVPYSKSLINEFQVSWLAWIDLLLSIYDQEEYPCEDQKFDSRYYDQIAPLIFQVAENSNVINGENHFGDEIVEDWCRAIGFLMHAISDDHIKCMQVRPIAKKITEKFLTDITQFCEGAIDQATEGQKDIIKAELNALVGLAIVLKEESLPMIEVLMNINKKLSTSDFESVITQGEGHSLFGNMLNNTFTDNPTINGLLSGSLTISAAMIFLRASACEALVHVAEKLGPIFEPCIPDTLDILQVNSEYKYNNLIVKSGVEGIPKIFGLIKDQDKPEVFRTRILPILTNNLDKLVKRRDKISRIEGAINVLEDCLAKYVPLDLSDLTDFLTKSGSGVMGALKFGIDNRNSLIQSYEELGNFTTEYDTMELMERLSDNSVIFGAISNLLWKILPKFKFALTELWVDKYLPGFYKIISSEPIHDDEYQTAFCFFCDWLDHLNPSFFSDNIVMMLNKAYEASEEILSKGRGLIQTVCYFLGQVTERMDHELFQEHEDKIFYIVNKCFIDPSMQSEFKGEAKDNAISALL